MTDTHLYEDLLPAGWTMDAYPSWSPADEGVSYTLSASNRSLDAIIRLRFSSATPVASAVSKLSAACYGYESAMADAEERT